MSAIKRFLNKKGKFIYILDKLQISCLIPDKTYLKMKFKGAMGKKLDLQNPKTYNEKLQWLKLYDRNPAYTAMVDKYEVKKYVAEKIGSEYVVPTIGVWDRVEDIDFDALPDQFVLKCTHDSGGLVICKDKTHLDIQQAKKKLSKALKSRFYHMGREWPYKNVQPRIIAEPYLEDKATGELRDYKFFCFGGKAKAMFVATERQKKGEEVKFDFYDMNFERLQLQQGHPNAKQPVSKPETFEQMRELAEQLSVGIPHVRVDFYEVDGKNYFGELTFFHFNGMVPFNPEKWDYTLGSWIELPKE
ncbi:MAG: glycosyl transferase [Oscillospiraceae bacterium]|nr:glycosyl transferase [Oscillospiraceae bacterium]